MQNLDQILATAQKKVPFSNGTSWEFWSYAWCKLCRNDIFDDCPLVTAAFMGFTPREWESAGVQNYECIEFEPREDQPDV